MTYILKQINVHIGHVLIFSVHFCIKVERLWGGTRWRWGKCYYPTCPEGTFSIDNITLSFRIPMQTCIWWLNSSRGQRRWVTDKFFCGLQGLIWIARIITSELVDFLYSPFHFVYSKKTWTRIGILGQWVPSGVSNGFLERSFWFIGKIRLVDNIVVHILFYNFLYI